ncbi:MAG: hypothetical protein EVA65_13475 [Oceanococcus sp.]|nr:MAG: hypothetical protein EVA65_13475 [Oceanococcus sp.]
MTFRRNSFAEQVSSLSAANYIHATLLTGLCESTFLLLCWLVGFRLPYTGVAVMFSLFLLFEMGFDIPQDLPEFTAVAATASIMTVLICSGFAWLGMH